MAYNAYVLYKINNPVEFNINKKRKRRKYLEKLAVDLIKPCIQARFEKFERSNFSGCQSPNLSSFKNLGFSSPVTGIVSPSRFDDKLECRKSCAQCNEDFLQKKTIKKNRSTYKEVCNLCKSPVCHIHSILICIHCKNIDKN